MLKANIFKNGEIVVDSNTVSDSINFDIIKFYFPQSWDGLTKTVVFSNADKTLNVILDDTNECFIPHEIITEPEFTVSVFGVKDGVRATTSRGTVKVLQSGYELGDAPKEPTPTEYERIISLVTETKEIAQSVRDDADSGALKGEKGDTGPQGEKGEPFKYSDFTAEQLENLRGPQGDKGDTGPQGEKGEMGPKGEKGDKGEDGNNYVLTGSDKAEIAEIATASIDIALDRILAIQNSLIGGGNV
ncbi:MAG: collagen-like protein [Clostridia bacterium]|nr:collagen-like protein [Clostridia bacterium]